MSFVSWTKLTWTLRLFLFFYQAHSFWVSHPKENMQFTTIEQMKLPIAESYFPEDSRIKVTGYKLSRLYPEDTRFVQVYNYDNDTIIDLISNNFEVCALEISNLYRYRWDLEVLFKWIKQNIVIKNLMGIFRKYCHNPSLECSHFLFHCSKNQDRL